MQIWEPYDNSFWKKTLEEESEKNVVDSGHLVPWQHTQADRTNKSI